MLRTLKKDIELAGQQLKKGDKLILHRHSINLDESVLDDALSFDITRAQLTAGTCHARGDGTHAR